MLPSLLWFSSSLAAPALVALEGRVAEVGSGRPVPGAVLRLDGAEVPLDPVGRFSVDVSAGPHTLEVEVGLDHRPVRWSGSVAAGQPALELWVPRQVWEEIAVYGEPPPHELAAQTYTATELRRVPGSFGDPIRALQSLPSVARPVSVEGSIVARGAEAVNTATSIDEIPVPYLYHFLVGRSVVDPTLLDSVAFYPGGMPPRLGRATQAVVDARTLASDPVPGLHGRIRADLLDGSFATEGQLGREWTVAAAGRTSWIGPLLSGGSRLIGAAAGGPALSLGYSDYLLRLGRVGARSRVVITGLGAEDLLQLRTTSGADDPDDAPPPPAMRSGFHRLHLRWDVDRDGLEHSAWIAAGPDHQLSLLDDLARIGDTVDRGALQRWQLIAHLEERVRLAEPLHASLGGELIHSDVVMTDYLGAYLGEEPPSLSERYQSGAAFGELQLVIGGLYLAPGARLSGYRFAGGDVLEPEPRLTVRQRLGATWTARAFLGRFSQLAPPDRFLRSSWMPSTAVMTSWQASVGLEGQWSSGWSVDATLYGTRTEDILVRDLQLVPLPDPPLWDHIAGFSVPAWATSISTYHPEPALAYGAELLLRLRPQGAWSGWIAGSVGRSWRHGGAERTPADYDLPWSLSGTGVCRLPRAWVLSANLTTSAGYPYTPQLAVAVVNPQSGSSQAYEGLQGDPNAARFFPYARLDLRAEKTWTAQRSRWTASLDLFNALNIPNPIWAEYNWNHTRLVPRAYVPILPNLGLEVSF